MSIKNKKRIYISVSSEVEKALGLISVEKNTPVASVASILLEQAIELEEDKIWDQVVSERKITNKKFYSHKKVWN